MLTVQRWCWPCLAIGISLLLLSASAFAQNAAAGPDWQWLATGALGLLGTIVGGVAVGFAHGVRGRQDALEQRLTALRERVLEEHPTRHDLHELLGPLNVQLRDLVVSSAKTWRACEMQLIALHARLDAAGIQSLSRQRPRVEDEGG